MLSPMNEQLRRIVVAGPIKEETAAQFLEQITALEAIDVTKPISVYIDTFGGSLFAALSMYDAIRTCACPVITIGIGKVMSAGVLLLAAGEKNNRFITQNTRVMVHEVSGGAFGSMSDLDKFVEETVVMQQTYINLLSEDTGKNKTILLRDMKKETFMSAKEAVSYGIADKLVPTRRPEASRKAKRIVTKRKTSKK